MKSFIFRFIAMTVPMITDIIPVNNTITIQLSRVWGSIDELEIYKGRNLNPSTIRILTINGASIKILAVVLPLCSIFASLS